MILIGQIATADGASLKTDIIPTRYGCETRSIIYSCPAGAYRTTQPETIEVDVDHEGPTIGQVAFLAQRGHGLFAVIDVDPEKLPDPPWYLSAELEGRWDGAGHTYNDVTLNRVAVVERSATVAKPPAVAVTGTLDDAHLYWDNPHRQLLREAADYARGRRHRYCAAHEIASDPAAKVAEVEELGTRRRPLELRSAPTLDVVEHRRTIEVLAAPVGEEATVIIGGRVVGERFAPGCFAGDEHRADRVKANREHNPERTIGKAVRIDPYSALGCLATLKISKTLLGDETLALAEDRVLDCSVGFRVKPNGEQWDAARSRRQVTRGELDHVSLVPDPAYLGAGILSVRTTR